MTFYDILFSALNGWSSKLTHYGNLFASFIGGIASFLAKVLKIKGNTVVWNQLVKDGYFPNMANWTSNVSAVATLDISDNTATVTSVDVPSSFYDMGFRSINTAKVSVISGHKYLVSFDIQASKTLGMRFRIANGGSLNAVLFDATTTMTRFSKIVVADTTIENPVSINISTPSQISIGDWFKAKNFCLFDLTKMFGATKADQIYSMEQSQAGSGVAYFRKLFPLDYYSYESGKLLNFNGVSIQTENADQTETSLKQLPISTYFSDGMKSAGSVYDELTPSKAVKRVGSVDLGTLNWQKWTNQYKGFYAYVSDAKGSPNTQFTDAKTVNYDVDYYSKVINGNGDKIFTIASTNRYMYIYDSAYQDGTAADFKTAVSGQIMYYELLDYEETAITENLNYTVYSGGTETLLPIDDISTSPFSANIDYPSGNEDVYFTIKESGIYE